MPDNKNENVVDYESLKKTIACLTVLLAASLCQFIKSNEKEIRALLEDKKAENKNEKN